MLSWGCEKMTRWTWGVYALFDLHSTARAVDNLSQCRAALEEKPI